MNETRGKLVSCLLAPYALKMGLSLYVLRNECLICSRILILLNTSLIFVE